MMQINSTYKRRFMQIDINISLKDKFHPHSSLAHERQPRVVVHPVDKHTQSHDKQGLC